MREYNLVQKFWDLGPADVFRPARINCYIVSLCVMRK
jgi:hypothetical protein